MQEMTNFTHPIELSNEELDLVAAGNCGCEGERNTQFALIGLQEVNIGVNVAGVQTQKA